MKRRMSTKLVLGMCAALLASLTFSAAAAQAQMWLVNGKGFEGEATFGSSGTFEIELPPPWLPLKCNETGNGRIYGSNKLEWEHTLTGCKFTEGGACELKPINWKIVTWVGITTWYHEPTGPVEEEHVSGFPTNNVLMWLRGNDNCSGFLSEAQLPIADPSIDLKWYGIKEPHECAGRGLRTTYGTEAKSLPVSTLTCPVFGSVAEGRFVFVRGSSTWQLTGAHIGEKVGYGNPSEAKAVTLDASGVSGTEATLRGTVNPEGTKTTYRFQYGPGTGYGKFAPSSPVEIGNGTKAIEVSQKVTGLEPNTIYHFAIEATNAAGNVSGEDKWFNTGTHEWALQPSSEPGEATGSSLNSISCTASEACAAVGSYWPGSGSKTLAKVEKAGQWTLTIPPNPSEALYSALYGVSCSASNACTAVGYSQKSGGSNTVLAERWSGFNWSLQTVPLPAGTKSSFLNAVACPASNDCTAVGYYQPESGPTKALVEHWNGISWSIVSTPSVEGATTTEFRGISCVSTSDCWAVGKATTGTEAALAEHWNGTAWSINSPSAKWLVAISCGSSSSCVGTGFGGLTMTRWNGTSWSTETAATPEGSKGNNNLTDVSCTSASACVATGDYLSSSKVMRELAESWNGSKWSVQSTSAPSSVEEAKSPSEGAASLSGGVSCTTATACTAVGSYRPTGSSNPWSMVEVRH